MINFAENLNKMITAGLGGETEAPRTEVAVGHRIQHLDASGPVATFENNIVAPLRKLLVTMLPIQAGGGDPSPENVRPITGRDSVTVTRTGKNLFDASVLTEQSAWKTVVLSLPPGTYTMSTNKPGNNLPLYFRLSSDSTLGSTTIVYDAHPVTRTVPDGDTVEVVFRRTSGDDSFSNYHYQIELGSIATSYESYQGQQVTIALGQTVYGGTLDVTTGKLSMTHTVVTHGGDASVLMPVESKFYIQHGCDGAKTESTLTGYWSDLYAFGGVSDRGSTAVTEDFHFYAQPAASPTRLWIYDSRFTTIADFKAYLADHPLMVVYPLAEPVEISLDPEQITTLIGDNNVWSDSGDVDVTYTYYEETEGY